MGDSVYIAAEAWLDVQADVDSQLDELVFEACSTALRSAGLRRHQIEFSVTSSLDLNDARSISSALTAPAAAAYLGDEVRVEGDASSSILLAIASLISGQVEFAIVVSTHVPEIGRVDEYSIRGLDEHVSSYTFDSHFDRPVGMTSIASLGMHASSKLDAGVLTSQDLVAATAKDVNKGAGRRRGRRQEVTVEEVANAPLVAAPLTELMLPANSAAVGAVVLGVGVAARRSCPNLIARVTGWGSATGCSTSNHQWLTKPVEPAAVAARKAYARAGVADPNSQVAAVEMTDLSPALRSEVLSALSIEEGERINPSGGVRSNYPGVANGLLRLIEGTDALASAGDGVTVVHASEDLCGLVTSTHNVLVLEAV